MQNLLEWACEGGRAAGGPGRRSGPWVEPHRNAGGGVRGQVAPQVAEGNQGVTEETQGVSHHVECVLVLIPLLCLEVDSN